MYAGADSVVARARISRHVTRKSRERERDGEGVRAERAERAERGSEMERERERERKLAGSVLVETFHTPKKLSSVSFALIACLTHRC